MLSSQKLHRYRELKSKNPQARKRLNWLNASSLSGISFSENPDVKNSDDDICINGNFPGRLKDTNSNTVQRKIILSQRDPVGVLKSYKQQSLQNSNVNIVPFDREPNESFDPLDSFHVGGEKKMYRPDLGGRFSIDCGLKIGLRGGNNKSLESSKERL